MCNIFLSFHPYLFVSPTFNKCLNCRINIKDIKIVKKTHIIYLSKSIQSLWHFFHVLRLLVIGEV